MSPRSLLHRLALLALGILLGVTLSPLHAQGRYALSLGGLWSSPLVHDRIEGPLRLQPNLAPTLSLAAAWPISRTLRAGPELSLASGGLRLKESGGNSDAGTLRSLTVRVGVEGPLTSGLWWRLDAGLVKYLPAEDAGVFKLGAPRRWLVGLGAEYRRRLNTKWQWFAGLRYDYHTFTTDELLFRGFRGTQSVHRVGLSIGLARAQ